MDSSYVTLIEVLSGIAGAVYFKVRVTGFSIRCLCRVNVLQT